MKKKVALTKTWLKKQSLLEVSALILSFLFAYTAIVKLYDWNATRLAMYNQVVPDWSKDLLVYGLPGLELVLASLLLVPRFRRIGFTISTLLMGLFTVYVAWVWFGLAGRVPCSCGGIISSLTWGQHLVLNLVFMGVSIVGLRLEDWKNGRLLN